MILNEYELDERLAEAARHTQLDPNVCEGDHRWHEVGPNACCERCGAAYREGTA